MIGAGHPCSDVAGWALWGRLGGPLPRTTPHLWDRLLSVIGLSGSGEDEQSDQSRDRNHDEKQQQNTERFAYRSVTQTRS